MHPFILRHRTKLLACFVVIAMFSRLHPNGVAPILAHPGSEEENCILTEYHMQGQNHGGLGGAEGSTFQNIAEAKAHDAEIDPAIGNLTDPEMIASEDEIGRRVESLLPETGSVVVLIVDDFQNPLANPLQSHGEFVLDRFDYSLGVIARSHDVSEIIVDTVDVGAPTIASLESHYRTDIIRSEIEERISSYRAQDINRFVINMSFGIIPCHQGITFTSNGPIIVDIFTRSGVAVTADMLPPDTSYFDFFYYLRWHNQYPVLSLPQYLEFLQSHPGEIDPEIPESYIASIIDPETPFPTPIGDTILSELLEQPLLDTSAFNPLTESSSFTKPSQQISPLDPLLSLLQEYLVESWASVPQGDDPEFIVVPVAAAGNLGGTMSLVPGAWDEVVSVGASIGDGSTRWPLTNAGELQTLGGWYQFSDRVYRAGTSFAAPLASAFIAMYLSYPDVPCDFTRNQTLFATPGVYNKLSFEDPLALGCYP